MGKNWVKVRNKHGVETEIPEDRLEDMVRNGATLLDSHRPQEQEEIEQSEPVERKQFTHAVIIRFHYKKDDPRFDWRFAYFKSMVLPKLLAQDNKDFDIAIWCESHHKDLFRGLSNRIVTFDIRKSAKGHIRPEDKDKAKEYGGLYFIDFTHWEDVLRLKKYDIQTGIDSDDLILRHDFIDRVEEECSKAQSSLHLSFQPYAFKVSSLKTYSYALRYGTTKGSPIFSLYQPDKDRYYFAYEDSHLKMGNYADESRVVPEGYCAFSVHDINESTSIPEGSTQITI